MQRRRYVMETKTLALMRSAGIAVWCGLAVGAMAQTSGWGNLNLVSSSPPGLTRHDRYAAVRSLGSHSWIVVYQRDTTATTQLVSSRSTDDGATWSSATVIYTGQIGSEYFSPSVDVNASGVVGVAWHKYYDDTTTSRGMYVSRSTNGGVTWGPEHLVCALPPDDYAFEYYLGGIIIRAGSGSEWAVTLTREECVTWAPGETTVRDDIVWCYSHNNCSTWTSPVWPMRPKITSGLSAEPGIDAAYTISYYQHVTCLLSSGTTELIVGTAYETEMNLPLPQYSFGFSISSSARSYRAPSRCGLSQSSMLLARRANDEMGALMGCNGFAYCLSSNGVRTWSEKTVLYVPSPYASSLIGSNSDSRFIALSAYGGQLTTFSSADGGETWQTSPPAAIGDCPSAVACDATGNWMCIFLRATSSTTTDLLAAMYTPQSSVADWSLYR